MTRPIFNRVRRLQEKHDDPSSTIDGASSPAKSGGGVEWTPCLYSVEGETVYDFAW